MAMGDEVAQKEQAFEKRILQHCQEWVQKGVLLQ